MDRGRGSSSYHCDHCGEKVSKTVYYQHKKMYYDKTTEIWTQREDTSSATKDVDTVMNDFCFSDDSDGIQTSGEY